MECVNSLLLTFSFYSLADIIFEINKMKVWGTAKNTVISPNLLVWKYCGKAQFPHQEIR